MGKDKDSSTDLVYQEILLCEQFPKNLGEPKRKRYLNLVYTNPNLLGFFKHFVVDIQEKGLFQIKKSKASYPIKID